MIFNSVIYENSMPGGMGTLEVIEGSTGERRLFIPLSETHLSGVVTGPLASLQVTQIFAFSKTSFNHTIEAIYRFPLPGDAMITGVQASFGEEILKTTLKEREDATDEYHQAFEQGRKGILLTRETPDIFTLHLTGIEPGHTVTVEIKFLQYAMTVDSEMMFRIPLTVAPRYIRNDEMRLSQRNAQPQLMLLDPGHTFSLDITVNGNPILKSPSHPIQTEQEGGTIRVTLQEAEVVPDQDFVLVCSQPEFHHNPLVNCQVEYHPEENAAYFLTTISSPKPGSAEPEKRELLILVDHSGSMSGAKWKAADWTVKNLLKTLQPDEFFNLGVFHDKACWISKRPIPGTEQSLTSAINFLKQNQDSGGTNLGIVLEQALSNPKSEGKFVRHIVIITDAEVTDEGRLIRMVREEQKHADPRYVSVICIDAAPNTPLVSELVRVGKGIARFLTSDPSEEDITTALSSALVSWKQPYKRNPSLIINRDQIESVDEMVNGGELSLRSLPYGTFSGVYRIPLPGDDISVALLDDEGNELSRAVITPVQGAGIRELFGSSRIRTLEQIRGGFYSDAELNSVLKVLGYKSERKSLYAETNTMNGLFLDELTVQESLTFGIPSSGTAFVCTSIHPGTPVKASVVVPSAHPAGWDVCESPASNYKPRITLKLAAPDASCLMEDQLADSEPIIIAQARSRPASVCECARCPPPAAPTRIIYTLPVNPNESESSLTVQLPSWSKLVGIQLMNDVSFVSPSEVKIEIYVGSRSSPVASIILVDLVDGEIRPLNIACQEKEKMKIVLKFLQKVTLNTEVKFQFQGECFVNQDMMWM